MCKHGTTVPSTPLSGVQQLSKPLNENIPLQLKRILSGFHLWLCSRSDLANHDKLHKHPGDLPHLSHLSISIQLLPFLEMPDTADQWIRLGYRGNTQAIRCIETTTSRCMPMHRSASLGGESHMFQTPHLHLRALLKHPGQATTWSLVRYTPEVEMKSENAPGKGGVLWKSCFSCAIFGGVTWSVLPPIIWLASSSCLALLSDVQYFFMSTAAHSIFHAFPCSLSADFFLEPPPPAQYFP